MKVIATGIFLILCTAICMAEKFEYSKLRDNIRDCMRFRNNGHVDEVVFREAYRDELLSVATAQEKYLNEKYNIDDPNISKARKILAEMAKPENARFWRNLDSRTTKTRREASEHFEKYLNNAEQLIDKVQEVIEREDARAYRAWAAMHPEQARELEKERETERRIRTAESSAAQAEERARAAESFAAQAEERARAAEYDAEQAEERARAAEHDAGQARNAKQDAEDRLQNQKNNANRNYW